jgi:alpha-galactosidase
MALLELVEDGTRGVFRPLLGRHQSYKRFDQDFVIAQCNVLAEADFKDAGYDTCSLDAGWNTNETDEFGRILYNSTLFDLPTLGNHLHGIGLHMGVYVIPGFPCDAINKTIKGTNIQLADVWNGNNDGLDYCDFDFSKPGVQEWHDSLLELWTSWGVDMIKLDFVTPGSPQNGANLVTNNSAAVIAYHQAIQNSGHQVRLDLSWKLCRNDTYYDIWRANAESMRTDQDIDNYGQNTFIAMQQVQRAIDNYRQYITLQTSKNQPLTIHPDMDNLFVGNPQNATGITDGQRITVMSHWIGAAANLILGSDLTTLDDLGRKLTTSTESIAATTFCSEYPMQPRNPGTGDNLAQQLQAWISGPSATGQAIVILTNLGASLGEAGYSTTLAGVQEVSISLEDLGIGFQDCYEVQDVWNGNTSQVLKGQSLFAQLDDGESQMLNLALC